MSLYGSGRAEGIATSAVIAGLVVLVHALGAAQAIGRTGLDPLAIAANATLPALGGVLTYRFLRSTGRSRFAGFLAGAAYGLSPWLSAIACDGREQWAAAMAPFLLEVAGRSGHPQQRQTWSGWLPLAILLPFAAGVTTVATAALLLAMVQLVVGVVGADRGDRAGLARSHSIAVAVGLAATTGVLLADPAAAWFGQYLPARPAAVLTAHRELGGGIDLPALLRLAGPVLLMFGGLGLLRHQRLANPWRWGAVAVAGAAPTLALTFGWLSPGPTTGSIAAAAWWLPLLAVSVLGAAGLDDFLDLPLRRRTALPWLLAGTVLAAPVIPLFAVAPAREWPLTATMLLLALLLPTWRRVGILRFKSVLATATAMALAVPALQVLPAAGPVPLAARPLAETATTPTSPWTAAAYAGGLVVLAFAVWSWSRRSPKPIATPARAAAAIRKKARPSK